MRDQGETRTRGGGRDKAFASALQKLKHQGCTLLVVGTAPDFVSESVCREMLGDPTYSTRRRLVVVTDHDAAAACTRLSTTAHHADPSTRKVLSFSSDARNVTAQTPPQTTHIPVDHVAGSTLGELRVAITEAIAEFEAQDANLTPAELRVCFDSLTPLVDQDRETLVHFLDLLNSRIRGSNGMGHMHLPVERDSEIVRLLEPLFDAVVELRVKDNHPQQRWDLTDADIQSGWLPHD